MTKDFDNTLDDMVHAAMAAAGLDPRMAPDTAEAINEALRPILENVIQDDDGPDHETEPKFFRATVELFIEAESESQACDSVSGLLSEQGLYGDYDSNMRDWRYSMYPVEVQGVPENKRHTEIYFADGSTDGLGLLAHMPEDQRARSRKNPVSAKTYCASCGREHPTHWDGCPEA